MLVHYHEHEYGSEAAKRALAALADTPDTLTPPRE
jgi:hypothetical protein